MGFITSLLISNLVQCTSSFLVKSFSFFYFIRFTLFAKKPYVFSFFGVQIKLKNATPRVDFMFFSLVFWATKQSVDVAIIEDGAKLSLYVPRNKEILSFSSCVNIRNFSSCFGENEVQVVDFAFSSISRNTTQNLVACVCSCKLRAKSYLIIITWSKILVSLCFNIEIDDWMD